MLTRNGYKVEKNPDTESLRKQLTVKPYVPSVFVRPQYVKAYKVYHETESFIYLPKQFGIARFGTPESSGLTSTAGTTEHWDFKGQLREQQLGVVGKYLYPAPHDGMICLQTGGGKTVCALYIASVLRVKTLIVVHNTFLKDQWEERIKSFLPSARIGRIQGEVTDVSDKDIIIAMIQSISMKEYPKEVFAGIGLTIVDECHHIASEVFVQAFPKITAQHMLGLSATPDRKDGLMYVIEWFLGPILFRSENTDKEDSQIRVEVFNHDPSDTHFNTVVYNTQGVMSTAHMINKLTEFVPRTKLIASILEDILAPGRQVLVLSDRVQHCKDILEALSPSVKEEACILAQSVAAPKRAEWCATKKILIATYSMCKEGFDVSTLNTLVMATPRPDIDQIVGRILRVEKDKRTVHPLIVDIVDTTFRRQFQQRLALYKKRMYTVDIMEIE
uniref:Helicase ATP-binding domain-containing protein n=1 Tax=viral metagenome TaxID=1070528 RepID=A0A6C0I5U4_9ZZZZ